ncbi:hypothetical protein CYLTODRAFT_460625 [Cylindrobasidium torrendii FP15055 ss-10]|uniref:Uncharacterized protein n=1 Tax=Cylindrobasidium torrendii FP15055 ss-10 TaxID=1314674 RepID=A0A0D7AQH4_9AGAR|nr:hypothetical protein CYLTODRAFT_460625 [Cylindrobasidium torrendii FP15055 ss-10]
MSYSLSQQSLVSHNLPTTTAANAPPPKLQSQQKPDVVPVGGASRGRLQSVPWGMLPKPPAKTLSEKEAGRRAQAKVPKSNRRNNKGWMEGRREELIRPFLSLLVDALEISQAAYTQQMKQTIHFFHWHFPWPMRDVDEVPDVEIFGEISAFTPTGPLPRPKEMGEDDEKARNAWMAKKAKVRTT